MTESRVVTALFRQRDFSALWWGQFVSLVGERCTYLALIALLAEHTHGLRDARSALLLSVLANMMLAPVLIFAPFAGAWIDQRNLRRVVVVCDLLRAAIVLSIPVVYRLTGGIIPVFALLFLLFTCGVFFLPAKSSLTPEIVPSSQLLAANTWLTVAGIAAAGLGTLGGGWLVDRWGWVRALELNSVTYLVSVGAMLTIRYVPQPRPPAAVITGVREYLRQLREGWSVIRDTAAVSAALLALATVWWCGGFLHVAGTLHVQRAASAPGVERIGVLFAALAAGGGLSAWWVNTRGRELPRLRVILGAVILAGAAMLLLAASTRFAVFLVAGFVMGVAAAPILLIGETMLQESTSPGMRARVFATRDLCMRSMLLVSVSIAAWVTRDQGAQWALVACGALAVGAAVVAAVRAGRPAQVP